MEEVGGEGGEGVVQVGGEVVWEAGGNQVVAGQVQLLQVDVTMEEVGGEGGEGVVGQVELHERQRGDQDGRQVGHLVVAHPQLRQPGRVGEHVLADKPDVV